MIRVGLDTAVLAVPNYGLSAEDANRIIDRTFHFSEAVASGLHVQMLLSDAADATLWECGCGPDFGTIQDFLEMMELSHVYSTNDVMMAYQTLLDRAHRARPAEKLEVRAFEEFVTVPPLSADLGPVPLRLETERVLATAACTEALGVSTFLVSGWSGEPYESVEVQVRILDVDMGESWPELQLPVDVEAKISLLGSPKEIISTRTATRAWESAANLADLHFSVAIRALTILRDAGAMETAHVGSFAIGPHFLASLERTQCARSGRIAASALDLCAQIVAGRCNRYIGPMGRPKQVVRAFDGALGWRVHLTDAHEGLRMMYWESSDGLEFANVGPKWELVIQEGKAGAAVSTSLSSLLD